MGKNTVLRDKIISILIIFISMVLMAGAIYFIIFSSHVEPVINTETEIMPDFVGYSYKEVKMAYAEYFDVEVESLEYSDEFPEGAILRHTPAEGQEYLKGKTTVKLTVSRGAEPAETTAAVTEASDETGETNEDTETGATFIDTDTDIENSPAEFESFIPDDEMDYNILGLDISDIIIDDFVEKFYIMLRKRGADAGFLYYDPQTGGSIEFNADEIFSSGSIIKAIYARSILGYNIDLDTEFEMTEELLNSPSELIGGKPVGTMFTVRELIEAALVKSDNTAYKMLYHYIGYEKFNRYAASLGMRHRMTDDNYWFRMSVRDTGKYLKEMYNFMNQHENGGFLRECMTNSEYDMFAAALPERSVAEKYGYLPQEEFYTLGDCAVVSGDTDYLVVMYTRGKGEEPDTQIFRDIAPIIDRLHELIHDSELAEQYEQDWWDKWNSYDWDEVEEEVPAEEDDWWW